MEPLIPELIQDDATTDRIFQESMALLFDEDCRSRTFAGYSKVRSILGSTGVCDRAANEILDLLEGMPA
jgi:lipid-A-disaccharide synthase